MGSLNSIIQSSVQSYSAGEDDIKTKLSSLYSLHEKAKDRYENSTSISEEKRKALENAIHQLEDMIRDKRQELYNIRDIVNVMLSKLETDVETMVNRAVPAS